MTHEDWQSRALAAERTVAVLKDKVKALYSGSGTTVQRQLERARQRSEETRRRQEAMAERNAQLQRYNEVLEREVARRTQAIKDIVDNVTFGFLIIGADMRIREGYTKSCLDLLIASDLANKNLLDVLGVQGTRRFDIQANVEQAFEDFLPEEVSLAQISWRFVLFGPSTSGSVPRTLHLDYRLVRDSAGAPDGVLVSISDITALENAQNEAAENRVLVNILHQRDAFVSFLTETKLQLATARECQARGDVSTLRRAVHTIKGNAGAFGLANLALKVHALEEQEDMSLDDLELIESLFSSYLEHHRAVLGLSWDSVERDTFSIGQDQLAELDKIMSLNDSEQSKAIRSWASRLRTKPAKAVLGPIDDLVHRLADRFEKRVHLEFSGDDLRVDAHKMRPVLQSLTHLVRNALDHGIEPPDLRGDKPAVGTLRIEIVEEQDDYHVVVGDDGRGVDVNALVKRAIERGYLTEEQANNLSPQERLDLMFVDGVSTARQATDVSGRGVGMGAVYGAVIEAGGGLRVSNAPGQGTRFHVRVPKPTGTGIT